VTNKYLNALLSYITGFETDIIKTGNSGEHALSMSLAENLNYSSGYSIEPYEFINILEKFGGLLPTDSPDIVEKGVEIFQIETRNPHFHEEKGKDHLTEMLQASLLAISNSKVCNLELAKEIKEHLSRLETLYKKDKGSKIEAKKYVIMDPIKTIPIDKFADLVKKNAKTFNKI
jgi:mannosyl-3-phosphoglycerate synthase